MPTSLCREDVFLNIELVIDCIKCNTLQICVCALVNIKRKERQIVLHSR